MSDLFSKSVTLTVPGMDGVPVRSALPWGDGLTLDLYLPPEPPPAPIPVVVFVAGYPDPGGMLRGAPPYTSWARLLAASGLAVVLADNRAPRADLATLLAHLRAAGPELGLAPDRIGLWAASGNVPVALAALARRPAGVRCAALSYGYALDGDGAEEVATAAARFGFVTAGEVTLDDLPGDVPLLITRAGADVTPGLNASLDRFVVGAFARDLPVTVVNVPGAPHAFDLVDDRPTARAAVDGIVVFLRGQLVG